MIGQVVWLYSDRSCSLLAEEEISMRLIMTGF